MTKFYLTTTLPYVNAAPHIGFALEIIQADAMARYKKLAGFDVFFNFGTDEHGKKVYDKALESGKDPKKYCDEYAAKFDQLKKALNLSYDNFIRTTDPNHIQASQEFWRLCKSNGDIYKKNYKSKYCVGCELEKTDSELVNGRCPLHPNKDLEIIDEENYFFRFSKYQDKLLQLYRDNPHFVVPAYRLKEITEFVKNGLQDFSISRLKSKMPWGIDVPDDPDHVMYVWFDALINYISALGWPNNIKKFNSWWPVTQFAGKDNLRQQAAIWQAMLLSAGLPNSKQIFIHGFISVNGKKISKSLGNVIDPYTIVATYGTDALRYYLLREIPAYGDGDFSERRFKELYNSDLANSLGNTVSRIAKLAEASGFAFTESAIPKTIYRDAQKDAFEDYRFDLVLNNIWVTDLGTIEKHIDQNSPWLIKDKRTLKEILQEEINGLRLVAEKLKPFLPQTAQKILDQFKGPTIKATAPLFPRLT
jgi:methionyl-tRNA synthetase